MAVVLTFSVSGCGNGTPTPPPTQVVAPSTVDKAKGQRMFDAAVLEQLRGQRFFIRWDEFVRPERIQASEESLRRLVENMLALGPDIKEVSAREVVGACVRRFNGLDDGWINTIEREDICEQIIRVAHAAGFDCPNEWLSDRDW